MHRLALPCILCLTFAACSSHYYYSDSHPVLGTRRVDMTNETPEAAEARQYATAEILPR